MNKTNFLVRAIDYTLRFLCDNGRGVREQYLRDAIKREFPMIDEREQRLWLMSLLEDMKAKGAISIVGSVVMITDKGREIAEAGGMEQYRRMNRPQKKHETLSLALAAVSTFCSVAGLLLSASASIEHCTPGIVATMCLSALTGALTLLLSVCLWKSRKALILLLRRATKEK